MVLVIEGLPYFAAPDKIKAFMKIVQEQDDTTLRACGAVLVALGLFILFAARHYAG